MITSFTGDYFFLSNFYPCSVAYQGITFPSSEHAYVAAKTDDFELRYEIAKLETPGKAKKFGRELKLKDGWDLQKLAIMRTILENKFDMFRSDHDLSSRLASTKPHILIEGNSWGDKYWGQSPLGVGRNELGKLLMLIRDDISRNFYD